MDDQNLPQLLWTRWNRLLDQLRSRLPSTLQSRLSALSNTVLTGLIGGLAVLLWVIGSNSSSPSSAAIASPNDVSVDQMESAPDFGPEQIAAVQDQISAIAEKFEPEILQSVQPDFRQSMLFVTIEPRWYDLAPERQDALAQGIWQQAQTLSFEKLKLKDPAAFTIARSPVVGDQVIILWRRPKPEAPEI
ncbi:MAG: hypothetical protein AAGF66_12450 [Cyanobacteria bacterium P01_H01_bin.119]